MPRYRENSGNEETRSKDYHKRRRSTERYDDQNRRSRHHSRSPRRYRETSPRRYTSESRSPPHRGKRSRERDSGRRRLPSASHSPPPKRRYREEEGRLKYRSRSRERSAPRQRDNHPHRVRDHEHPPRPRSLSPARRSTAPLPSQLDAFHDKSSHASKDLSKPSQSSNGPPIEKQKANFNASGLLAAETNTVANTNIVLKYNEPPESRLPPKTSLWRLYIFKGSEVLETLNLHERTCWLFGREQLVVDHVTEHPSCSKQHAVIQFRYTEKRNEFGEKTGRVKPYVIDLESANGTSVNGERLPEKRYVEVKSGDVVRFGDSSREYVLLLPPKEREGD